MSAGYAQDRGALINLSVTQENLFGTGNAASLTLNNSTSDKEYGVSYTNPYFTPEGISRRLFARYKETDGAEVNIANYSTDAFRTGANFGIPFNEYDRLHLGLTGERVDFTPGADASTEVRNFAAESGGDYLNLLGTARWSRDSRDRRVLPTRGSHTSTSAEAAVPGSDLTYYRLRASHQRFFPLTEDWTLMSEAQIGIGDGYGDTDSLPLPSHFFAGGTRSVRGFRTNSLGPQDDRGEPLGGDVLTLGRLELIVPLPFVDRATQFRLTGFLDGGNVFASPGDVELGELRYSTGISTIWFAGIGIITTSLGFPLNQQEGDERQRFQFTIGTSF